MPWPAQLVTANAAPAVVGPMTAIRGVSPVRPAQWTTTGAVSYAAGPVMQQEVPVMTSVGAAVPLGLARGTSPVQRGRSPDRPVESVGTAQSLHSLMYATGPAAGRASFVPAEVEVPVAQQQVMAQGEQQEKGTDNEFMKLLDSLEVRVDLMAQMQHTRNQIQAHAQNFAESASPQGSVAVPSMARTARSLAGSVAFTSSPPIRPDLASFNPGHQEYATDLVKRFGDGVSGLHRGAPERPAPLSPRRSPGDGVSGLHRGAPERPAPLSPRRSPGPPGRERQSFLQQSPEGQERKGRPSLVRQPPEGPQIIETEGAAEARLASENAELWLQLREQRDCIGKLTQEVEGLQAQLSAVSESRQATGGRGLDELRAQLGAALQRERECSDEVQHLHRELVELRQEKDREALEWQAEREHLLAELMQLRGRPGGAAALATEPVLPPGPAWAEAPATAPFSRQTCGVNVTLSEDGYVATRTRGCRQSVLLGSAALQRQDLGWYFEVEICETVEGWVGGLGIGVTRTSPSQLRRIPDKAWRMQDTFIVGYWGCVFLNGKERRTHWRADTLPSGAHVGLLVSGDGSGDMRVFVDGTLVVSVPGALAEHAGPGAELFPVVDVFAATLKVALLPQSLAPPPPWGAAEGAYSPPGSPANSLVSVPRSICSSR